VLASGVLAAGCTVGRGGVPQLQTALPENLFPSDNWWSLDVSGAPLDPKSMEFIDFIANGSRKKLHPDFGGNSGNGGIYGFPYIVVDGSQAKKVVNFRYAGESDGVDRKTGKSIPFYPIPDQAITEPHWIENGPPGIINVPNADRHMLIVDRENHFLYELFSVFFDGTEWQAGSGAFFDMKTNNRRPKDWTSADAAGLAILPGLTRYEEVFGPHEITHGFRVTLRATSGYVYPASHGTHPTEGALPLGARLRLKSGRDLSRYPPEIQKIFRAMKKYGLIVADNGDDMFVGGTYDTRWDNDTLNPAFHSLSATDFEVVERGYRGSR
jgi:hypothetical protein